MKKIKSSKKATEVPEEGVVHITASFNNILISVATLTGDVISASSSGRRGFRGAKKTTPLAARLAAEECVSAAYARGLRKARIEVKGVSPARESAIQAVGENGVKVTEIRDMTPEPYNGCRSPKQRKP